ncbi:MAG: UDP-N-acetylmuramoyl-L-alanine--D-glutamate ligase [Proteobacteria bacterium]|jgi:UDP-N-acetylmuramoylalanine--D-glutamate ligase|nr:UDP-N-acetylmuramoyl-L-alanine--D-glutamate ligase [Pseudomonadota bacterium]
MKKQINLQKDRFAVIGTGDTGLSISNYLKYAKANLVKVFDTRDNPPHQKDLLNVICGKLDFNLFIDIDVIVISPGISIYDDAIQQAIHHGILVIGDIELFALAIKKWQARVIGITGSNGKTTVTALTGYLAKSIGLKTMIAGNIGVPVLNSYIEAVKNKDIPEIIVLELSSFQLESTHSLDLDAATVLNISEDHLDRYRDLLEYVYVKSNIFNNCKVQIINANDMFVGAMIRHNLVYRTFGINSNSDFSLIDTNNQWHLQVYQADFIECSKLNLVGVHNYLNVLVSLALLDAIGIDIKDKKLSTALCEFSGLEHRMQKVLTHNGVVFIEDSKGTNVGAVTAGVSGLDMPVHLILGGDGKGQDFSPLRDLINKKCKSVAVIGQDKLQILEVLHGLEIPIANCTTLEEAVSFCYENAIAGDAVILSPACASWDMFDNYKHRAEVFVTSVKHLTSK